MAAQVQLLGLFIFISFQAHACGDEGGVIQTGQMSFLRSAATFFVASFWHGSNGKGFALRGNEGVPWQQIN